ncbi:MAG: methyltransferase family protein, partial [Gammaproteobacteria bacterium]
LICTGSAIALGWIDGLVTVALFTGVFVHKIHLEERMLTGHFGDAYTQYRKRTNALILFVW